MRIALTGSTGELGGRIARRLHERGADQIQLVRDPARAPVPAPTAVIAGYDDSAAMQAGMAGADTLLFIPASEDDGRVATHQSVVDAAAAAGVGQIVYFSFVGSAPDATFLLARDHFATEQAIKESRIAFTFLRMNFYLDSIPQWVGEDGALRGPAGDGKLSACSRDDMADVAAVVLTDPAAHAGKTYDLTGREAFSFAEATSMMSELSGKTITYVDETLDEARASRAKYGAPDWEVEGWISAYTAVAAGELAEVTDVVPRLSGHEAQTLTEYVHAHRDCLDHVLR